ncbi:MAG: hypothetical protein ABIH23_29835 [bacterium]
MPQGVKISIVPTSIFVFDVRCFQVNTEHPCRCFRNAKNRFADRLVLQPRLKLFGKVQSYGLIVPSTMFAVPGFHGYCGWIVVQVE